MFFFHHSSQFWQTFATSQLCGTEFGHSEKKNDFSLEILAREETAAPSIESSAASSHLAAHVLLAFMFPLRALSKLLKLNTFKVLRVGLVPPSTVLLAGHQFFFFLFFKSHNGRVPPQCPPLVRPGLVAMVSVFVTVSALPRSSPHWPPQAWNHSSFSSSLGTEAIYHKARDLHQLFRWEKKWGKANTSWFNWKASMLKAAKQISPKMEPQR